MMIITKKVRTHNTNTKPISTIILQLFQQQKNILDKNKIKHDKYKRPCSKFGNDLAHIEVCQILSIAVCIKEI